jgi:hypothetical protein
MRFSDYETFLRPVHLQGRRVTVTIQRFEEIDTHLPGQGKKKAICVYFQGKSKPFILSTPNRRFLMDIFGDDVKASVGQVVALEARPIRVAGVEKMVIRMFMAQPMAQPEAQKNTTGAAPTTSTQLSDVAVIGNGLYARTRPVN